MHGAVIAVILSIRSLVGSWNLVTQMRVLFPAAEALVFEARMGVMDPPLVIVEVG